MVSNRMLLAFVSALAVIGCQVGLSSAQSKPTCLSEDGNPVDWFIAYKLPIIQNQGELYRSGLAYIYVTSENVKASSPTHWAEVEDADSVDFLKVFKELFFEYLSFSRTMTRKQKLALSESQAPQPSSSKSQDPQDGDFYWTISAKPITDPKSLVLRTLAVAYDKKKGADLNSIFYNDAPPDANEEDGTKSNSLRAHAKGILLMDEVTGDSVWMTHSTPQFPPSRDYELKFGENFVRNGQTFMCINYDIEGAGKQIINHLINMNPLVYEDRISAKMFELIPELNNMKLTNERKRLRKNEESTLAQTINTRAGMELQLFSKSASFGDDLYSNWMNDELKSSLYVESWLNGQGGPLDSYCSPKSYHVNNVKSMKLDVRDSEIVWSSSQDHSKWAISNDRNSGYVCITDINRMQSQFKRGGGGLCIRSPSCWSLFSNLISDVEPCPVEPSVSRSREGSMPEQSGDESSILEEIPDVLDGPTQAAPIKPIKFITLKTPAQKIRTPWTAVGRLRFIKKDPKLSESGYAGKSDEISAKGRDADDTIKISEVVEDGHFDNSGLKERYAQHLSKELIPHQLKPLTLQKIKLD